MTHDELKAEIKKHLSIVGGKTQANQDTLGKVFIRHVDDCKNNTEAIFQILMAMVEAVSELEQEQPSKESGFRTS